MEQKRKGRRSGQGSKKGKQHALLTGKDRWMMKIRPMRHELQKLRAEGKITSRVYRELYLRAKGNSFRNTAHLRAHIADHKLEVSR
jgi:large subunit ribosomal protein L19e